MKKLATFLVLSAALALPACGGGEKKKDDKVAKADKKDADKKDDKADAKADKKADEKKPDEAAGEPPFSHVAFVRHKVADYDKWKTAFDDHQSGRAEAGIITHWLYQDAEDSNTVMFVAGTKDLAKIGEMMGSEDMKKKMAEAGVEMPPELVVMGAILDAKMVPEGTEPAGSVFIFHEVENADKWLEGFKAHDEKRVEASIIGHGVIASAENPNMIGVHLAYSDGEKIKAMMGSEDMKKVMADAGVKGEPTVYWGKMVEEKTYETTVAAK